MLAYYDLPGRIAACSFVGREANPRTDVVFKMTRYLSRTAVDRDAGVAFLMDPRLPAHPRFGQTIFVLDDPVVALRLQLAHLRDHVHPLPLLVISPDAPARAAWQWLPQRRWVFWSPSANRRIEQHAALADCEHWVTTRPNWSLDAEGVLNEVMRQAGIVVPDCELDSPRLQRGGRVHTAAASRAPQPDVPLFEAQQTCPWRRPDWRWLRARQWIESGRAREFAPTVERDGQTGSRWIRRAAEFLQRWEHASERPRLAEAEPAIYWALKIHEDNSLPRWAIEAYLLARETDLEIGFQVGLPAEVVEAYEALFYCVREKLQHSGYVMHVAIGDAIHQGLGEADVDLLWRWAGYAKGPYAVDMLVSLASRSDQDRPDSPGAVRSAWKQTAYDVTAMKACLAAVSMPYLGPAALPVLRLLPRILDAASPESLSDGHVPADLADAIAKTWEGIAFVFDAEGESTPSETHPPPEDGPTEPAACEAPPPHNDRAPAPAEVNQALPGVQPCDVNRPDQARFQLYYSDQPIEHEEYEHLADLLARIRELDGQPLWVKLAMGQRLGLTRGPFRFLRTPYGAIPVFEQLAPEELEEDPFLGERPPELSIPSCSTGLRGAFEPSCNDLDDW